MAVYLEEDGEAGGVLLSSEQSLITTLAEAWEMPVRLGTAKSDGAPHIRSEGASQ